MMKDFILNQARMTGLWYTAFVGLEFILPIILFNLNIPVIEQLTKAIELNDRAIILRLLIEFLLVQLFYELIWRLRDLVKINCSIVLKRNSSASLTKFILSLKQSFFIKHTPVEITNVIRNITESSEKLFIITAKVFRYFAYICFMPIKVMQINISVTIIFIFWILSWIISSIYLFYYVSKESVKLSNVKNKLLIGISDVVHNIDNVFVYKTYSQEEANLALNLSKVMKTDKRVQLSFWKIWVLQGISFSVFTCLIIFALLESNSLRVSVFVILYKIISDLIEFMWSSSDYIFDFVEHYGKVRNGFNRLSDAEKREPIKEYGTDRISGKIIFSKVKYLQQSKLMCEFDGISIKKNSFVALIGQSGSGKTTFAKLLLHIFEPDEGLILNTITNTSFAYAEQRTNIFKNTLRYNLTYGISRKVSDHEIHAILKKLGCNFISILDNGLNSFIDPKKMSIGELQKLSVARALLADAEITVFDEPTSALDLHSETQVMQAIYSMKTTRIVIAHKIHTIKNADQIILFDSGQVIAHGNYQTLKENPFFQLNE